MMASAPDHLGQIPRITRKADFLAGDYVDTDTKDVWLTPS